jgi:hypothetical protein
MIAFYFYGISFKTALLNILQLYKKDLFTEPSPVESVQDADTFLVHNKALSSVFNCCLMPVVN